MLKKCPEIISTPFSHSHGKGDVWCVCLQGLGASFPVVLRALREMLPSQIVVLPKILCRAFLHFLKLTLENNGERLSLMTWGCPGLCCQHELGQITFSYQVCLTMIKSCCACRVVPRSYNRILCENGRAGIDIWDVPAVRPQIYFSSILFSSSFRLQNLEPLNQKDGCHTQPCKRYIHMWLTFLKWYLLAWELDAGFNLREKVFGLCLSDRLHADSVCLGYIIMISSSSSIPLFLQGIQSSLHGTFLPFILHINIKQLILNRKSFWNYKTKITDQARAHTRIPPKIFFLVL